MENDNTDLTAELEGKKNKLNLANKRLELNDRDYTAVIDKLMLESEIRRLKRLVQVEEYKQKIEQYR